MLSSCLRLGRVAALGPCNGLRPVSGSLIVNARFYSKEDDSHDDFKPKKKAVPQGVDEIQALIKKQVDDNPIMLYMKGTPSAPSCGFSMQTVRILNATGASYSSVNVLEHDVIREGIKKFSDWPTIPQLYVKGEFVGGCDIVTSMYQNGELETLLKENNLIEADDN